MSELRRRINEAAYLDDADRFNVAPELHQPHWDGLGQPHSWICSICWGDGWTTAWPCEIATKHGKAVAEAGGMGLSW